jgi:hypothetical protein
MSNLFPIVKKHIDAWDPFSLLAGGAPSDEFDSESMMVAQRIRPSFSAKEIARIIRLVFSSQFDALSFPEEDCMSVAEKIKSSI